MTLPGDPEEVLIVVLVVTVAARVVLLDTNTAVEEKEWVVRRPVKLLCKRLSGNKKAAGVYCGNASTRCIC